MNLLKQILNIFFPITCAGCGLSLLQNERSICTSCRHRLPLTYHHLTNYNIAMDKFYGRLPLEYISAMLYFYKEGITQHIIHHLKYRNRQELGTILGYWYGLTILEFLKNIDIIVPVPIHKKRYRSRGYNQVTTFCEAISECINVPINNELLFRKTDLSSQTKKSLSRRTDFSSDIFEVSFSQKDHEKHYQKRQEDSNR